MRLLLDGVGFVLFCHRALAEAIAAGRKAQRRSRDFPRNSFAAAPSRRDKWVIKQGLGSAVHVLSNASSLALTPLRVLQTAELRHTEHATAAEEAAGQEKRAWEKRRDQAAMRHMQRESEERCLGATTEHLISFVRERDMEDRRPSPRRRAARRTCVHTSLRSATWSSNSLRITETGELHRAASRAPALARPAALPAVAGRHRPAPAAGPARGPCGVARPGRAPT